MALLPAALLAAFGELLWLRPEAVIRWITRLPKPIANIYLLYFRIRGIEPDSSEGVFWFRFAGLFGILASGVVLLTYTWSFFHPAK